MAAEMNKIKNVISKNQLILLGLTSQSLNFLPCLFKNSI